MSGMPCFRKKPVEIEAVQFDGSQYSQGELIGWLQGAGVQVQLVRRGAEHRLRRENELDHSRGDVLDGAPPFVVIPTLEGDHRADVGDWVIRGVQGEFYPCKPDIFAATYDVA